MLSSGYWQSYINIQIQKTNQQNETVVSTPIRQIKSPSFSKGDKVNNVWNKKIGTIDRLRDDRHEKTYNHSKGIYHYSVTYDDNTFETYEHEKNLEKI